MHTLKHEPQTPPDKHRQHAVTSTPKALREKSDTQCEMSSVGGALPSPQPEAGHKGIQVNCLQEADTGAGALPGRAVPILHSQ